MHEKNLYLCHMEKQNIIISVPSFFPPTTHFLHFIHKWENTLKAILYFSSRTSIPEAALPCQGNYLHTHTHLKIWTMRIHPWQATGIKNGWVLVYTMWGSTYPSTWNNSRAWWSQIIKTISIIVSTDTRQCEDRQWCWLVRNNTHAFLKVHSGSAVFTRSSLQVLNQLEGYVVCQRQTHLVWPISTTSIKYTLSEAKILTPKPVWKARSSQCDVCCPSCLMI